MAIAGNYLDTFSVRSYEVVRDQIKSEDVLLCSGAAVTI